MVGLGAGGTGPRARNNALDNTLSSLSTYRCAMSRFIQFLDTKGFELTGPSWPLHRTVIPAYPSGASASLNQRLTAQGTSLGEQAAAFWGDRLNKEPLHGPQLRLASKISNQIEIDPGTTEVPISAKALHTRLFDFKLKKNVQRVEFEFEIPGGSGGYFWGLANPDASQRFLNDESRSTRATSRESGRSATARTGSPWPPWPWARSSPSSACPPSIRPGRPGCSGTSPAGFRRRAGRPVRRRRYPRDR